MKLPILVISALTLSAVSAQAQSTIDFQDIPTGSCAVLGPSVTSGGFTFQGVHDGLYSCLANLVGNNTSAGLINANSRSVLTMFEQGGAAFSLQSFFAGGRFENQGFSLATGIDIVGNVVGGGSVFASVLLDAGPTYDFVQYLLPTSFANLSSVTFTAAGTSIPEFIIDDIAVNGVVATPEPATLSLLLLGLPAIAAFRRRQKA